MLLTMSYFSMVDSSSGGLSWWCGGSLKNNIYWSVVAVDDIIIFLFGICW